MDALGDALRVAAVRIIKNERFHIACLHLLFMIASYSMKLTLGQGAKCKFFLNKAPGSKITIGDDFIYTNGDAFNPLCRNIRGCICTGLPYSKITIGNGTGMSSACLWANSSITIGNHVKIGGDCILLDSDAHSLDYHMRRVEERIATPKYMSAVKTAPIVIEDDVLIGTRCIILKGVTIGARSVIGSGSVVTKSIPPDCIAAGNPCKVVKSID